MGKRPNYAGQAVRALKFAFAKQLELPAVDLERATIVKTLVATTKKGSAAMAAQTAAYGKALFNWAVKRGTLEVNPFAALPVAPTTKRDRVLSDDELAAIWRATRGGCQFNSIVRLLTLTVQRRDEGAGMAWSEVAGNGLTWTLPAARAKNGAAHAVPLPPQAREHLGERGNALVLELAPQIRTVR